VVGNADQLLDRPFAANIADLTFISSAENLNRLSAWNRVLRKLILEEYHLLGCDAVWYVEMQPKFRRNVSPPSSRSKKKFSKNQQINKWQAE
jgi:hypothetical protein